MRNSLVINKDSEAEVDALEFNDTVVHVYLAIKYPYVKTIETEVEAIMKNDCLKHYFLKAVDTTSPKFIKYRECGIYFHGNAKAELKPGKDGIRMKIETSNFESLPDMVTLREMIYAGTILPSISYENKQVRKINIYFAKFVKLLKKITKK